MTRATPRRMWELLETIHAVVYFAPEVRTAMADAGLRGFWMGYFAGRAAPLGEASAELVIATFYNFAPSRVRRAIPDAWGFAAPAAVLEARQPAVRAALVRLLGEGADVERPATLARRVARACDLPGRPLYAAHVALPFPDDPLLGLWHAATLVREHRGDGHVAALVAAGIGGLEAHVLRVATGSIDRRMMQESRGWTDEDWTDASTALRDRGLLGPDTALTDDGRRLLEDVEDRTDRLASAPWSVLEPDETRELEGILEPLAATIAGAGEIPYPNPIGVPRV